MSFELQSIPWTGKRAILLVHGIGNAKPGDYTEVVDNIKAFLGDQVDSTAIYQLWYDQVNDWFASKTALGDLITKAEDAISGKINDPEMGQGIAESMGDVLWPVLSADARAAAREAYLAQVKQIVVDGINAGVPARRQKLSIICHSLGCFHTYEALHHMTRFPSFGLQPATHEVQFENVIFMASPVQLIRTVADAMGNLVPNKRWLYSVQGDTLSIPSETTLTGMVVPSVKRWVAITGDLDPIGGHFFKKMLPWAYMNVPGQVSRIDNQQALHIATKQELVAKLREGKRDKLPPLITKTSPHDWQNYVSRNAAELKQWIAV